MKYDILVVRKLGHRLLGNVGHHISKNIEDGIE